MSNKEAARMGGFFIARDAARCHPERSGLGPREQRSRGKRSEGSAFRGARSSAKCEYHDSLRSSQVGLAAWMGAIFFARAHPFNSFSRWIATLTSLNRSNQTSRLQLYRAVNPR